jgi:CP family cyanate transporter-like MFS transporter
MDRPTADARGNGEWPTVPSRRVHQVFIAVGLVVLAVNLRPAAVSVAPVLSDLEASLSMGSTTAGLLTTLPVLCFAAFGLVAPWCARAIGVHKVMLVALAITAVGLVYRTTVSSAGVFIAATIPVLAGVATANVLLPSLVKLHFPHRIGRYTAIYSTAMATGLSAASFLTVPIADATGSWRGGLASWGVLAAVAVVPWLGLMRHDVRPEGPVSGGIPFREVATAPLAWWLALFFGLQSLQAYAVFGWLPEVYRGAGLSAQTAGLLLGVATAIGIPLALVLPGLAVRRPNQTPYVLGLCACYLVGYLGLLAWPVGGAWVWAVLIGIGTGVFPLTLTLIGLRARTSDGTAALSGFSQSVGYLIGAVGPFMMGALFGLTGSWTVPIWVLTVLVVPLAYSGVRASAPHLLEDQLS